MGGVRSLKGQLEGKLIYFIANRKNKIAIGQFLMKLICCPIGISITKTLSHISVTMIKKLSKLTPSLIIFLSSTLVQVISRDKPEMQELSTRQSTSIHHQNNMGRQEKSTQKGTHKALSDLRGKAAHKREN